jgi:hypothetical protein
MLWWTHRLLRRVHPWPYRDGVGLGIVEVGPRRGVVAPIVVAGVIGAIVLAFSLPLPLTLTFAAIGGGGAGGGGAIGGHGGSCCGGHVGSSCCGGRPPSRGVE